jgi:AraC family transcriptional regulator of adaptative response/methylated-DNA-[protein]-cysteine methyltransferase
MPAAPTAIPLPPTPPAIHPDHAWAAVLARDSTARHFVYAVTSTGIFCRSGCPSRTPARENVLFFATPAEARAAGFHPCRRCQPEQIPSDARLAQTMATFLDDNRDRHVSLAELGSLIHRSHFTAQRIFRRTLGLTPAQYQRQARAAALRAELHSSMANTTHSLYTAGYSASSRAYESAPSTLGMSPGAYRSKGRNQTIHYCTGPSSLGTLLIARTTRGFCAIALGDHSQPLIDDLRRRFQSATVIEDDSLAPHIAAIDAACSRNPAALLDLPLDLSATAFQMRVWEALRRIPPGQTRSYAQVAEAIHQPTAVRAVARACASNPAALLVPCHRVIGGDGKLTGYRWGISRKKQLLDLESAASAIDQASPDQPPAKIR